MERWIILLVAALLPQTVWAEEVQATLQWSQRVELSTPVSGIVQSVNVEAGDGVKKGQVLLNLDSTVYQARVAENRSEITRLNAEAEESKRDLKRVQELYERTVVSTADLDQAKLRLIKSQAALSEAQSRLRQNQKVLDDATLRAPFDAVVILREAEPGLSVAAGLQPQMLLTLARAGEMIARSYLSLPQMNKLKVGQPLTVSVSGINHTGSIKMLGMEPIKIDEQWVYPVDVVFPSKEPLRAGTPAQLQLP